MLRPSDPPAFARASSGRSTRRVLGGSWDERVRIAVTGPGGFIAGRVLERLSRSDRCCVVPVPREAWDTPRLLARTLAGCDVVLHLAGVTRARATPAGSVAAERPAGNPTDPERANPELAHLLVEACRTAGLTPHLVYSSTTARDADTPYGRGKRRAEEILARGARELGGRLTTLVLPGVFGAGCRPLHNSVIATFCHQLARGEQPTLTEDRKLELLWVDDLADTLAELALTPRPRTDAVRRVCGEGRMRVSELLATLDRFRRDYFERGVTPELRSSLEHHLHATFLAALPPGACRRRLATPNTSTARGTAYIASGTECVAITTESAGQATLVTTQPGVTRGNHYHNRTTEQVCVVRGEAIVHLRLVGSDTVHEYAVMGAEPACVTIPVRHTHAIENVGSGDLITLVWSNEPPGCDGVAADTFHDPVLKAAVCGARPDRLAA